MIIVIVNKFVEYIFIIFNWFLIIFSNTLNNKVMNFDKIIRIVKIFINSVIY